jgi:hypothetical protein
VTIDDEFYVRIGRMTVAFGGLDFMVDYLAAYMAAGLGVAEPSQFTARKLETIKSWAREHADWLGKELVDELVNVAGEAKVLLRHRQDAIHGLWLQGADAPTAWTMRIPRGRTIGVPTETDGATVDALTQGARTLENRVARAALSVQKLQ